MAIHEVLKRIIGRGNVDAEDLLGKMDVLFAFGRLTSEQYTELANSLNAA